VQDHANFARQSDFGALGLAPLGHVPRSEGSRYSSSPGLSVDKIPARLFQGELTQMSRAPNVEENEKTNIVLAAENSGRTLLPGTSVTIHLGSSIAPLGPRLLKGDEPGSQQFIAKTWLKRAASVVSYLTVSFGAPITGEAVLGNVGRFWLESANRGVKSLARQESDSQHVRELFLRTPSPRQNP
jgi:hypothetical protein